MGVGEAAVLVAAKNGLQTNEYGHLQIDAVRANTDAPSRAGCCRSPFDGACGAVFWRGQLSLFLLTGGVNQLAGDAYRVG